MNLELRPSPLETKPTVRRGTVGAGRNWQTGKVIRPLATSGSYDFLTGGVLEAAGVSRADWNLNQA